MEKKEVLKKISCEEALNILGLDYRDRKVFLRLYGKETMILSSWKNKLLKKQGL